MTGPLLEGRTLGVGDHNIKNLGQVETLDGPIKHPNESHWLYMHKCRYFSNLPGTFLGNLINVFRLGTKKGSAYTILVQK